MSLNFTDSFDNVDSNTPDASAQPFGDGYVGFDSAQQFGSFPNFADPDSDSPLPNSSIFTSQQPEFGVNTADFSSEKNGPILPEMLPEEGYARREWTRQNSVRLEEKEILEKQLLAQILDEADVYKTEFHKKRQAACETNKVVNREKEKVFLDSLEKFHVEADKDYWKSIAELVPKEVPVLEKKGKEKEKKPSIAIMLGPKPGKPTDLSRMRQTLIKLKHDTPAHLKPLFHAASTATADDVQPKAADVEIPTQPIAVA